MNQSFDTTAFHSSFHTAATQALSMQEAALAYTRSQTKLVREQQVAMLGFANAGFDASADYALSVQKSLVAALAPKVEAKA